MSSFHLPDSTAPPKRLLIRLLLLVTLCELTFTTACTNVRSTGRTIYESPDTVVRLEPASQVYSSGGAIDSHPALLPKDHIDVLLTSISARTKVGFLRSLVGDPGTPRLFDRTDIGLLASPIQEALAKTEPGEVVVFYRTKKAGGAHARVTSGVLFVRDEMLVLYVANFWNPVITVASEVGSKDRLEDVRETTTYVRGHPWVSVGEQDFAIFFDDPKYQLSRRDNSLWKHPARTVAVAYAPYLKANPDPVKRAKESEEAIQQAAMPKTESQFITDLKKRLLELERANDALTEKIQELFPPATTDPHPAESPQLQTKQPSTERLVEMIERLQNRISELEREIIKKRK